jgi:hypothetical protein
LKTKGEISVVVVPGVDDFNPPNCEFETYGSAPSGRRKGALVRRACVPRYLGLAAEGNPCRILTPPHQYSSLTAAALDTLRMKSAKGELHE